ncbi:MAG: DVU3141 family protein [Myxococcales bacterium]
MEARTASERALLGQIATLPSGSTQRVGDATVVAEESYTAASGRTCRPLHITSNATRRATLRLACLNGRDWLFVPDVYGDSSPSE